MEPGDGRNKSEDKTLIARIAEIAIIAKIQKPSALRISSVSFVSSVV